MSKMEINVELSTLGLQVAEAYKNQFQIVCILKTIRVQSRLMESPTHGPKLLYVKNGAIDLFFLSTFTVE